MQTKKFTKLPETHPLEKTHGRIGISGVPGQGRASRYGPYGDRLRCWLRQATVMSWRLGPHRLRSGGEDVQSGSRDGLLNGSPDGLFSCSKTSDSAKQAITWFSIFGDYCTYLIGNMSSLNNFYFMVRSGWVGNKLRSTIFLENSRCDVNFHQLETPKIQQSSCLHKWYAAS